MTVPTVSVVLALPLSLAAVLPQAAPGGGAVHAVRPELVYWDTIDDSGRLTGGRVELLVPERRSITEVRPAHAETLTQTSLLGAGNRLDMVFVGDGYQAGQIGAYATHVNNIVASFFTRQPYTKYQNYFAVHRIDVVSVDSGVDNDPSQGVLKNTALDMAFWCNGIERLLCVNVGDAYAFANNAPDVDLVAAVANSSKYGGAGYPTQDLGTASGNNSSAVEIMMHEFGHALGNLADEYDYNDGATYTGGEPASPNTSKLTAPQMTAAGTKWAAWIGFNDAAFDGLISAYQGAAYHQFGLYRPTNNSLMRNLGRPFNLPSAEQVIFEIYRIVDPIDASSSTSASYTGTETLFVTPMQPVGHSLSVQWFLNGTPIAGATGTTLNLATLGLGGCAATVSVRVRDDIAWVRDEAQRAALMTQTLTFDVVGNATITPYCSTSPNSVGPGALMGAAGSTSVAANDLTLIATGCPAGTSGLFYFGTTATQVPFGNGFRCIGGSVFRLSVMTTDLFGDAYRPLDFTSLPPGAVIGAGDTKRFQFWYRNPAAGGAGFNLSNGIAVQFCP